MRHPLGIRGKVWNGILANQMAKIDGVRGLTRGRGDQRDSKLVPIKT